MPNRNHIIDNLRCPCMLSVIAIHIGSLVYTSATPNEHIFMLFQILSRFSVPAFFFISGYGLFSTYPLETKLNYKMFLRKRLRGIGLPYLFWSLFYLWYGNQAYPDDMCWTWDNLSVNLFFGNSMYHIYFLVLLMWFYLLFPLWRHIMCFLERHSLKITLPILAILQLGLYKASAHFWSYPDWVVSHEFLFNLLQYRLNYFPFFYLFVFLLGGILARNYDAFLALLHRHWCLCRVFFFVSAVINASLFYHSYYVKKLNPEVIVNTLQQLSLPGFVYTLAALLFFVCLFDILRQRPLKWVDSFAQHSFFIYLIHPLIMNELILRLSYLGIAWEHVPILPYYAAVLLLSWGSAIVWSKLKKRFAC